MNRSITNQFGDEMDSPPLGRETDPFKRSVPHQTDNTGSAYRIRPQTPRINLLNKSKNYKNHMKNNPSMKLEKLDTKQTMSIINMRGQIMQQQ